MSMKNEVTFNKAFERGVLRAAFRSLFWAVINEKKKQPGGYKLVDLANMMSVSKHEVSRWFNGDPNWTVNSLANIATALNVEIQVQAVDKATGRIITPAGVKYAPRTITAESSHRIVLGALPRTGTNFTPAKAA